jgi:hypothetical protein
VSRDAASDAGSDLSPGEVSISSDSRTGLEMPEDCELARRIVNSTEQYKAVWSCLQKHAKQSSLIFED